MSNLRYFSIQSVITLAMCLKLDSQVKDDFKMTLSGCITVSKMLYKTVILHEMYLEVWYKLS